MNKNWKTNLKLVVLWLLVMTYSACNQAYKAEEVETSPKAGTQEINEVDIEELKEIFESEGEGIADIKGNYPELPEDFREIIVNKSGSFSTPGFEEFDEAMVGYIKDFIDPICWEQRPQTITELTDGVLIDAYSFDKDNQKGIGLLGFLNINLTKKQKVLVIEYLQEGTQYCSQGRYKYGVGARLLLHIISSKSGAKLNTPQQITASVIFGKAEVTYSLKTIGITGPGVAQLNKAGSLSDDTYQDFLQEISNLIVDIYKDNSKYIVTPQPLFLKNQKLNP